MKKMLLVVALSIVACHREDEDKLCAAIGDTPRLAVQPRDRLFFEENCDCIGGVCRTKKFWAPTREAEAAARQRSEAEARHKAEETRTRLAKVAEPLIAVARSVPRGALRTDVLAAAAQLKNGPYETSLPPWQTYEWRLSADLDRCALIAVLPGSAERRLSELRVDCEDLLGGEKRPKYTVFEAK